MGITIDAAGRVVIPQAVRRRLGLTAGVELEVEELDGGVLLRPAATVRVSVADDGLPILRSARNGPGRMDESITVDEVRELVEQDRPTGRHGWHTP